MNDTILAFLRATTRKENQMLGRPSDYALELKVVEMYSQIIQVLKARLEEQTKLEDDLQMLAEPNLPFELRTAVTYRAQRKIIIHSQ